MNIEFRNLDALTEDDYLAFREDGIIYHLGDHHWLAPYESIIKISSLFGVVKFEGRGRGKTYRGIFMVNSADKKKLKEAIAYTKSRMVANPSAQFHLLKPIGKDGKVDIIDEEKTENLITVYVYRKRCDKCDHIIYYTKDQLDESIKRTKDAVLSSVASVAGSMSGHYAAGAAYHSTAEKQSNAADRILDLSKCPECYSKALTDLEPITMDEYKKIKQEENKPILSSADEIKKYKDLLDSGVITQEEFDEKKKQLLGL